MKQKLSFFIVFCSAFIGFSCEDESLEEKEIQQEAFDLVSIITKSDMNGGQLPEVIITAERPRRPMEEEPQPDWVGGEAPHDRPWWEPPVGGGGNGGGQGTTPVGSVKLSSNLLRRFPKGCNLSEQDLKKLNEEYKKMIVECVYQSIDKYVSEHWTKSGEIKMHGAQQGLASIDSKGNLNIYGSDQITATNLAHEWIHTYQMAFNPVCSSLSNEYAGMMEFELALFQDLICFAKNGYTSLERGKDYFPEGSCWINSLKGSNRARYYQENAYKGWLKSICINNQLPVKIDQTMYLYWAHVFEGHRGYSDRGYNFQNKEYGTKTLESLLDMAAKNCFK